MLARADAGLYPSKVEREGGTIRREGTPYVSPPSLGKGLTSERSLESVCEGAKGKAVRRMSEHEAQTVLADFDFGGTAGAGRKTPLSRVAVRSAA
jgi:hypothetical protein